MENKATEAIVKSGEQAGKIVTLLTVVVAALCFGSLIVNIAIEILK